MFSTTKIVALFSVLSATGLAADVYSAFLNADGTEIGTTQFDVSNGGCFTVPGAYEINFSQGGPAGTADGPYCLTGFSNGGCSGNAASQQFATVNLDGQRYDLNDGLANVGSYRWSAQGC